MIRFINLYVSMGKSSFINGNIFLCLYAFHAFAHVHFILLVLEGVGLCVEYLFQVIRIMMRFRIINVLL